MLKLSSELQHSPILSLQTGGKVAEIIGEVFDPSTLQIIAYRVSPVNHTSPTPHFVLTRDVREVSTIGFIIDSAEELIEYGDVVHLDKLYDLHFELKNLPVIDEVQKGKIGRIQDYTIDINDFVVRQISVKPGILRRINESSVLIHRSQIIEVTDTYIKVKDARNKIATSHSPVNPAYINPFRSKSPQAE